MIAFMSRPSVRVSVAWVSVVLLDFAIVVLHVVV
jgi:hypothetical protein